MWYAHLDAEMLLHAVSQTAEIILTAIIDADAARLHTYLSWWPVRSVCRPTYMTYPWCRSAMHAPVVHVPVRASQPLLARVYLID